MPETPITQQLMMNSLSMNSQIMQGAFGAISSISNMQNGANKTNNIVNFTITKSIGQLAYAVEGDSKYDEEIDSNKDGIITYNEYVRSITDKISSKYNIPKSDSTFSFEEDAKTGLLKFSVNSVGKMLTAYLNNSIQLPIGIIEKEA